MHHFGRQPFLIAAGTLVTGIALAFLVAASPADAQPVGKMYRVGYLGNSGAAAPEFERVWASFRQRMQELGYIEGSNLVIEQRFAEGRTDRYPVLAAELVGLKVDVIVVVNNAAARSAKNSTATIPIVMTGIGDPVKLGLVSSLARPGGNVTGISAFTDDLVPKRLELLKTVIPQATRIVIARCPKCGGFDAAAQVAVLNGQIAAAKLLGMTLLPVDINTPQDFENSAAVIARQRPDALLLANNAVNVVLRGEFAKFAIAHKLPTVAGGSHYGAMMSYGPDLADNFRIAASYVAKILKGAKPGDLPVEQPTRLELIVNLKTAKALGITIPQSVLLRADEIIQ